jgi:hypothetical protein
MVGYINHLNYSDVTGAYTNTASLINTYHDALYVNLWYWYGYYQEWVYYAYNEYTNYCSDGCYQYYSECKQCNQKYNDHSDYSRAAPAAYTLPISSVTPDSWTTLSSAVPDLKTLRDEIQKIAENKVKAVSGSTRPVINFDTTRVENADAKFMSGQLARAAQINETIANIEKLYQAIMGTGSGLIAKTAKVSQRKKQDYKDIISKAQTLASQAQTYGYQNHSNTGDTAKSSYVGYRDVCNNTTSPPASCNQSSRS